MMLGPLKVLFLIYCIYRCLVAPVAAQVSKRRNKIQPVSPVGGKRYSAAITYSIAFAGIALVTAFKERIPVFGSFHLNLNVVLLAAAFLIVSLAWARLEWTLTPMDRKLRSWNFLPHTPIERVAWVPISLVVGSCEEIVFRGVLFGIVFQVTGSYWMAGLVSAILFALMHLATGLLSVVSLVGVAIGLQWLVQLSGGLHIAIAVHFVYNAVNGIVYGAGALPEAAKQQHMLVAQLQASSPLDDPPER
ncbi:MAG TPA: CPBP family intramembrane glutamic endopeptidase [Acidobacteriota bacterium]|nr:CPBP family intramembrane glutamic endopeptidase [Acidobacteriota bacterium]